MGCIGYSASKPECQRFADPNPQAGPLQLQVIPGRINAGTPGTAYYVRAQTPQEAVAKTVAEIQSGSPLGQLATEAISQYTHDLPGPAQKWMAPLIMLGMDALTSAIVPGGSAIVAVKNAAIQESQGMAIDLGGLLSGLGGAISGIDTSGFGGFSQTAGSLLTAGGTIYGALTAPSPTMVAGPVYSPQPAQLPSYPQATPVSNPVVPIAASQLARMVAPILLKVATALGLKRIPTLKWAINAIRKMGKFITDPNAIAVALGITTYELASLITAHSAKKSRRMNPANGTALRRAARRIKSFHRMCGTIDLLKSRGRRRSVGACGTCRKSPCRC